MTQYMLSVHGRRGRGGLPHRPRRAAEDLRRRRRLQREGARRRRLGLRRRADCRSSATTCVDNTTGQNLVTDGPFAESKEYLGGFWIIEAPDLDAALKWAAEGSKACAGKVEVRPFQAELTGMDPSDRICPAQIERVFREEHARVVASLARRFGDLDIAEEAAGEALVLALEKWPVDGLPPEPRRLAHHHRRQQGHRPDPPRGTTRRQAPTSHHGSRTPRGPRTRHPPSTPERSRTTDSGWCSPAATRPWPPRPGSR